jgi:hypothetical protein
MGKTSCIQIKSELDKSGITESERLPAASRKVLERLASAPMPRSLVNPGPRELLVKSGFVELRRLPLKSPQGDVCLSVHLVITARGRERLAQF